MSTDREMDKEDVVHIYNGILLSHKQEGNNAIYSNIDGPRAKWSKPDRKRQKKKKKKKRKKTKYRTTIGSSNPTPGHLSEENHSSKRCMHPTTHSGMEAT